MKTDDRLYAIAYDNHGYMIGSGRVEQDNGETVRLELHDAMDMVLIGAVTLSGEIKDVSKKHVRLFNTYEGFEQVLAVNAQQSERAIEREMKMDEKDRPSHDVDWW